MFSSSREGFSHVFLVDLINTCHRKVSPLLRFPWLFQYLSSALCFPWYCFNYSFLLLLDLNCLNSPWVLSENDEKKYSKGNCEWCHRGHHDTDNADISVWIINKVISSDNNQTSN